MIWISAVAILKVHHDKEGEIPCTLCDWGGLVPTKSDKVQGISTTRQEFDKEVLLSSIWPMRRACLTRRSNTRGQYQWGEFPTRSLTWSYVVWDILPAIVCDTFWNTGEVLSIFHVKQKVLSTSPMFLNFFWKFEILKFETKINKIYYVELYHNSTAV